MSLTMWLVPILLLLLVILILWLVLRPRDHAGAASSPPPTFTRTPQEPAAPTPPTSTTPTAVVQTIRLTPDEHELYQRVAADSQGVSQRDLVDSAGFSAAKLSRLLDRLVAKGLVVKEPHGMTNWVLPTQLDNARVERLPAA